VTLVVFCCRRALSRSTVPGQPPGQACGTVVMRDRRCPWLVNEGLPHSRVPQCQVCHIGQGCAARGGRTLLAGLVPAAVNRKGCTQASHLGGPPGGSVGATTWFLACYGAGASHLGKRARHGGVAAWHAEEGRQRATANRPGAAAGQDRINLIHQGTNACGTVVMGDGRCPCRAEERLPHGRVPQGQQGHICRRSAALARGPCAAASPPSCGNPQVLFACQTMPGLTNSAWESPAIHP
jgi:hypothetical protein